MKNLLVRVWYLLLGGVLVFLSLEYLRLREERIETMRLANESVETAHNSLIITNMCLESYAKLKAQVAPAVWDLRISPTATATK